MSLLSLLFEEPWMFVATILVFIMALAIHECAHAYAGFLLGDMTAKRAGRLTLNPLAHIDPLGFVALLAIGFGWAKPVPYNPYNLRNQRWGPLIVALAGPFSNLIMGILGAMFFSLFLSRLGSENLLVFFLARFSFLNFGLMLFNLIPVPPLDGAQVLMVALSDYRYRALRERIETQGPSLLMMLMIVSIVLSIPLFSWISNGARALFLLSASIL